MTFRIGDIQINTSTRTVLSPKGEKKLQPRPFALLSFLIEHRDRVVSKDEIIDAVWEGRAVSDAALSSAIRDIRRAFGAGTSDVSIRAHYGRGLQFVTTAEFVQHLAPVATAAPQDTTKVPVVGVLPLDNMTPDPNLGFLVDGLAEDIITKLSRFRDVKILARNTSFSHRGQHLSAKELGKQLDADYLIEGGLRRSGGNFRLTAQLIDAKSGTHHWAQYFDWPADAEAADEDAVTSRIATTCSSVILGHELNKSSDLPFHALNAWEAYVLGYHEVLSLNRSRQENAIGFLERAIELDPGFALSYAMLSYSLNIKNQARENPAEPRPINQRRSPLRLRALELAQQSIKLDPLSAFGWITLGRCQFALGQVRDAIIATEKALTINPDHTWAHYILGMALWQEGRAQEAIDVFDKGLNAGPNSEVKGGILGGKACALYLTGDYEEAYAVSRTAQLEYQAGRLAYIGEILALSQMGDPEAAYDAILRAQSVDHRFSFRNIFHDLPLTDQETRKRIADELTKAGLPS
ncbi:MAG: winged helix-turn-helix domain-containing tetratricopeptide repeat protein [Tateyamaria sp.]